MLRAAPEGQRYGGCPPPTPRRPQWSSTPLYLANPPLRRAAHTASQSQQLCSSYAAVCNSVHSSVQRSVTDGWARMGWCSRASKLSPSAPCKAWPAKKSTLTCKRKGKREALFISSRRAAAADVTRARSRRRKISFLFSQSSSPLWRYQLWLLSASCCSRLPKG